MQVTSFVLQDESIAKKAGRSFSWPTIALSTKKAIDKRVSQDLTVLKIDSTMV